MLAAWQEQGRQAEIAGLGFDERFALLVEAEWLRRENERLVRNLREAKLRLSQACLEDIDYSARRELDRAQIRQLATCRWVAERQSVLITGATGTVRPSSPARSRTRRAATATAPCIGVPRACSTSSRCARADGTYARLSARLARVDVLVIDDFGLAPLEDQQGQDLLEVLEDRHDCTPPSSPASSRCRSGTPTSRSPRSPMRSATASSTTPIASC